MFWEIFSNYNYFFPYVKQKTDFFAIKGLDFFSESNRYSVLFRLPLNPNFTPHNPMRSSPSSKPTNTRASRAAGDLAAQIQARLHGRRGDIPLSAMSRREILQTYRKLIVSGVIAVIFSAVWVLLPNPYTTQDYQPLELTGELNYKFFNAPTASGVLTTYNALGFDPLPAKPKSKSGAKSATAQSAMPLAVPRHIIDRIPADLHLIKDTETRKRTFVKIMLPLALVANSKVQEQRRLLLDIREILIANQSLNDQQNFWINDLAKQYKVEWTGQLQYASQLDELLLRVDEIPVSLILAQGAIESAWGTSRFSREGNALFGEWTTGGKGIVPLKRETGKTHKIRVFSTPLGAVDSFIRNLNTHRAYAQIRSIRGQQRQTSSGLDGYSMAVGLDKYSQLGKEYSTMVQKVMNSNTLTQFDRAYLK